MMSVKCLPPSTVKLIGSSQVITSVSAAVKELVENSLDAGALSIDVKLENHGMDKIEVRDNGCGVNKNDVELMCKKSYTSKLSSFADLDNLHSYGFRGEALNALCAVSKLSVTTKTEEDTLAYTYQFDSGGSVNNSKPSHVGTGTIILVEDLFKKLPVRRQFLTNGRRKSEEIKKVESIIKSLAIIHPRLRLSFTHNKFLIWQKNSVSNLKQSLAQAIAPTIVSQLDSFNFTDDLTQIDIQVLLPRKDCNISVACFTNKDDAFYVFINLRPVRHKELEKVIESEMFQYFGHHIPNNKYPFCLVSITLAPDSLDVNLEPNKTRVMIKDLDVVINKLKNQFIKYYTGLKEAVDPSTPVDIKLPKRKLDVSPSHDSFENSKIIKIDNTLNTNVDTLNLIEEHSFENYECKKKSVSEDKLSLSSSSDQVVKIYDTFNANAESLHLNDSININELYNEKVMMPQDKLSLCCSTNQNLSPVQNLYNIDKNSDVNDLIDFNTGTLSDDKIGGNDTLTNVCDKSNKCETISQEIDDLELFLSRSTQSSIIVEPDLNASLDCFSDDKISQNLNNKEVPDNVNSLRSEVNCCESNRDAVISEFMTNLPVLDTNIDYNPTMKFDRGVEEFSKCTENVKIIKNVNSSNNDVNNITLSQWSKGQVLDASNVPVLIEQKSTSATNCLSIRDSKVMNDDSVMFEENCSPVSEGDRSVSSQMGCKNMSGFTKFAKEMRVKILEQTPGISFTRVAALLAAKWKALGDTEKSHYEELVQSNKLKEKESKLESPEPSVKQTTLKLKSTGPAKGLKKIKYDTVSEIGVTLSDLKSRLVASDSNKSLHPQILCKLTDDLYFYSWENSLSVLSAMRLNEVITYYKNMSTMTVPLKVLENNIPIRLQDVGDKNWHTLQCLETSVDLRNNTIMIANEMINKNGFRIEVTEGVNDRLLEITDVPTHVSFYGIDDLNELLGLMDEHGASASLVDCRPLKIASYIRSETIRACSTSHLNFENKGRDSMFNFWIKNVRQIFPNCPHHKPVAKELFKIDNH